MWPTATFTHDHRPVAQAAAVKHGLAARRQNDLTLAEPA